MTSDSKALRVDDLELARLDAVQLRPPPKEWDELLVSESPLLCEVFGFHGGQVIGELLHAGAVPAHRLAETLRDGLRARNG